jgi:hypothetical protein
VKISIRALASDLRAQPKRSKKIVSLKNNLLREKALLALPRMSKLTGEELGRPSEAEGNEQHPDMPIGWTRNLVHGLDHGHVQTAPLAERKQRAAKQAIVLFDAWLREGLEKHRGVADKWNALSEASQATLKGMIDRAHDMEREIVDLLNAIKPPL